MSDPAHTTARETARALLHRLTRPTESVFGGFGLDEPDAQKLIDAHDAAIRAAAFAEAIAAVVAFTGNDLDANAQMLRRLAAAAPATTTTPQEN